MASTIHVDAIEEPTDDRYFHTLCGQLVKERYLERVSFGRYATCRKCIDAQHELSRPFEPRGNAHHV